MTSRGWSLANPYDVVMSTRRVTLNLDVEVVEALEAQGARSLSAAANDALRQAVAAHAHRAALLCWLDELDDAYGLPTQAELAAADALLDEAGAGAASPRSR